MTIRRWFVGGAGLILAVGAASRDGVVAAARVRAAERVEKLIPSAGSGRAVDDIAIARDEVQGQVQEQRQIQGSLHSALRAPVEMTARLGAKAPVEMTARLEAKDPVVVTAKVGTAGPGEVTAGSEGMGAAWEAKSVAEDPADLKGERVKAVEAEPLAVDQGAAGLEQMLRKLRTRASLMLIIAHPDDEDGGMLAYESRGQGARVGMLTLTRGEGGQNVVTGDFDEALGLVRTRELLAADRYMGVDQMFGTEVDFGFSKTKEEAFQQWGHQRVLYDAVRAVRLYRPLVVASVFIGAPSDGHGQHQVSGEMAQEVFTAAADPKVFPEMGLPVWAPAKVYGRMPFARIDEKGMFDYATGKYVPARFYNYVTKTWSTESPKATVTIPEGETSALLGGKSYVQFAREGLALQRTQIGAGVRLAPAGKFDVGYTRYGAARGVPVKAQEESFFDGVDTSLVGIATLAPGSGSMLRGDLEAIARLVERAQKEFSAMSPEKTAPVLRDGLTATRLLIAKVEAAKEVPPKERYDVLHELRIKERQFNDALVVALGLQLEAKVDQGATQTQRGGPPVLLPGEPVTVRAALTNRGSVGLHAAEGIGLVQPAPGARTLDGKLTVGASTELRPGSSVKREQTVVVGQKLTEPYWTKASARQPYYDVADPAMRNAPLALAALTAWMNIDYDGVPLRVGRVVGGQEMQGAYQPVAVVSPVSVGLSAAAGVVPLSEKSFAITARVRSAAGSDQGTVRLEGPKGWKVSPESARWSSPGLGKDVVVPFTVTPERIGETPYTMTAVAESGGKAYREGYHEVGYPGLTRDNLYAPATYRARGVDVKVPPGLKVAYLPGTGDAVQMSMEDIGIRAATVSVEDIAAGRLGGYDALVMGVRAYAAHKDLAGVTAKLMEFASAGGVVVVQYNSAEYDGPYGPYPYTLSGAAEKVVEEDSAVRLLDPGAQVLSWPNKITEKDFGGWIEERGHGFMREWDPQYEAVTEVHDAGQDPQRGGLLVAKVGKGAYVYCAYALYRQLPEGVPGAFRVMANLVSLGRKP